MYDLLDHAGVKQLKKNSRWPNAKFMSDNLIHYKLVLWRIIGNNILDRLEHFKLLSHAKSNTLEITTQKS